MRSRMAMKRSKKQEEHARAADPIPFVLGVKVPPGQKVLEIRTRDEWRQAYGSEPPPEVRGALPPDAPAAKFDSGKLPWHLLPYDAVREVVRVLAFGASKYAARNWEKGLPHSRTFAATMRHLTAHFQDGETHDAETGISHLAHAACEILFALAFEVRGRKELDDRPGAVMP